MEKEKLNSWFASISAPFVPKDLRLDRIKLLLKLLGNPHEHFKSIHVAGTSGKGSTCTFISSILSAHGYRTGLNLSPHVEKINERIQLNGIEISDSEFTALAEKVYPAWQETLAVSDFGPPTFFEVITAMAFEHFVSHKVDYAVVEVGLGGRLDATNVLLPKVSVITPISLDHTETLGKTVEEIAFEKAGIIKRGVPVVTSAVEPALGVIQNKAAEQNCALNVLGEDFNFVVVKNSLDGLVFNYSSQKVKIKNIQSNLLGSHQGLNASAAIAACSIIEEIEEEKVRAGVANAAILARLEVISRDPMVILDGAHNGEKIRATVDFLLNVFGKRKVQVIMGIVSHKDPREIIREVLPICSKIFFVSPQHEKQFHDAQLLCSIAKEFNPSVAANIINLSDIQLVFSQKVPTCITGSLYLAGIVKKALKQPASIPIVKLEQ